MQPTFLRSVQNGSVSRVVAFNLVTFLNNFPTKTMASIGLFTIPSFPCALFSEFGAERK